MHKSVDENTKIILFDVDGTLVKGSKNHWKAFNYALQSQFNVSIEGIDWSKFSGSTDSQIIFDLLVHKEISEHAALKRMPEIWEKMIDFYQTNISSEEGYILSGVNELLENLEKRNVVLGLVTGNLQQIAQLKLKKIGIKHIFEFGGFGDEHYKRGMLIKYAVRKAIKIYGFKADVSWKNTIHVGDTPQDVVAARYANVKNIIVETGNFKKNEHFKENQPDLFLKNFSEKEELEKFYNFIKLN